MVVWSEAIATGEQDRDPARVLFRRLIASRADGFIVPGRLAHGYIRTFSPDGPVCLANNSVEEERIALGLKETVAKFMEEEKIATFSGSLIERKGVHLLLKAFKELFDEIPELRRRWKLRLLGAGPMDVSGFSDPNIVFEGFCEGEDYAALMRQSHVFVLPSLHDPNPLTVIEALFAGNVIIVSNRVGNYPEAVCGNGFVIGWNSVEDIKKALCTVFRLNNIELARMAARSLEQAKAFTTTRSAAGFFSAIGCRRIESSLGLPCLEERTAVNG
jgi:glycosyltransferase involved in cell wall biosynthesis